MRFMVLSLSAATMLAVCSASHAEDKQPEPPPGIELTLAVVETKPDQKSVFRCILKNTSDRVVEVGDSYDGKSRMCLFAKGEGQSHESWLHPALPKKSAAVAVKAGEERVVFELPVDDILFDPIIKGEKENDEIKPAWKWDWPARSLAPSTPFHAGNMPAKTPPARWVPLLRRADFWAKVLIDGRWVTTKVVTLELELRLGVVPAGKK